MPVAVEVILAVLLMLAGAIWIGGMVTVVLVSVLTVKILDGADRVRFFQVFGSAYNRMTSPALAVALVTGWIFLSQLPWSGELTRIAVASVLLVLALGAGIAQARGMTRLRARAATEADAELTAQIRRRARTAGILRGLLGLLTLGITVQVAVLLVDVL